MALGGHDHRRLSGHQTWENRHEKAEVELRFQDQKIHDLEMTGIFLEQEMIEQVGGHASNSGWRIFLNRLKTTELFFSRPRDDQGL